MLKNQIEACLREIEEDSGAETNEVDGELNGQSSAPMDVSGNESAAGYFIDKQPTSLMNNSLSSIYKNINRERASPEKTSVSTPTTIREQTTSSTPVRTTNLMESEKKRRKLNKKGTTMTEGQIESEAQEQIDKLLEKQQKTRAKYVVESKCTFDDFGGVDDKINELKEAFNHFQHPNIRLCDEYYRCVVVQGPPGVGKSTLIEAVANYLNVPLLRTTLTGSENGEKVLTEVFELAKSLQPSILLLDKVDFVCSKSEVNGSEKDRSIVSHLIKSFESLPKFDDCKVMIVATTNKLDKLDAEVKNLFEATIKMDLPNEQARIAIIQILFKNVKLDPSIDVVTLAQRTPGFVARDYKNVLKTANHSAIRRISESERNDFQTDNPWMIEKSDMERALVMVEPLFKSEGFATIPKVSWNDIGALKHARALLKLRILDRVRHSVLGNDLNLNDPVGILMYGPPGCGKTLLAKAIANEADINFISVRGPELLNKYVGESERAVRELFARANHSKPCLIFFDEFDAISKSKSDSESHVSTNIVKQLLTEMDGFNSRSCFMLAATNRPDLIDPAIMRPGRFGKGIYIGFPEPEERADILKAITKNGRSPRCGSDVDFDRIALDERLNGFSGADLKEFVTIASEEAFKELIEQKENGFSTDSEANCVTAVHFDSALSQAQPSLSAKERKAFEKLRVEFENRSKA